MRALVVVALIVAAVTPAPAAAAEYEAFVEVSSEEELIDLLESEQISGETFDTLGELLRHGVDLDAATREELYSLPNLDYEDVDRILAYRAQVGKIGDPARLVLAGVLTDLELHALLPFLRRAGGAAWRGWLRLPLVYVAATHELPATALAGQLLVHDRLTVGGVGVLTRLRLGDVGYDPTRDALVADEPSVQPALPKLYVRYDVGGFSAIAGSYRIGFGQRLTFDDTSRLFPHGFVSDDDLARGTSLTLACKQSAGELFESPCAGAAGHEHTAPDFHWREGLFGAALGVRGAHLSLHAWVSSAVRPVYQYELYDRRRCVDPRSDDDPACAAPAVFRRQDDPLAPTSRFAFSTLPGMFRERTAGANLSWFAGARAHLGVTAYASSIRWQPAGLELDFQEWARYPRGGGFGALGVDGAAHVGLADLGFEVTRSFDGTPRAQGGGGDLGAILRTTTTWRRHELETVLRYYGPGFANPYARPVAEPDEAYGQRARDEAGLRLRYRGSFAGWSVRGAADVWVPPSDATRVKTAIYLRGDLGASSDLRVGVSTSWQDSQHKLKAALHLTLVATPRLTLAAQYSHALVDDASLHARAGRRHDASAWLIATWNASSRMRWRTRVRWRDGGLGDDGYLESSLAASAELGYRLGDAWHLAARYEWRAYLDDRPSTLARTPNPEHWLLFEVEARF